MTTFIKLYATMDAEPCITAAELIVLLQQLPPDMPICCINGVEEESVATGLNLRERCGVKVAFIDYCGEPPWRINDR